MIEVFSTDISCEKKVKELVEEIHSTFSGYRANFDLADCDNILRIVYGNGNFECIQFASWLKTKGCMTKVLTGD